MKQKSRRGRKLLSLLLALAMVIGLLPGMAMTAQAATSFTIEFKDNGGSKDTSNETTNMSDIIKSGTSYVSSVNATKVFQAQSGSGIRLSSSRAAGSLTLNLANPVLVSSITVKAKRHNKDSGASLSVLWEEAIEQSFSDYTYTYSEPEEINSITLAANKRVYITSVTVAIAQKVDVTGVTMSPDEAQTISVNENLALTATIAPEDATNKKVIWSVGGTDAGAVTLYYDNNCTMPVGTEATSQLTVYAKGISGGNAIVTATSSSDNAKSASCNVKVHAHDFTYSADGATITAVCGSEECTLTGKKATLTISAPTQSGGAATLSGDTSAFTLPDIKYATRTDGTWGAETTTPPAEKGSHKASITLGSTTASVTYGISSITVQSGITGGTVTVPDSALVGSLVTPIVTAAAGCELDTLTATANGQALTITDGSFTMPEDDVIVNAVFNKRSVPVTLIVTGERSDTSTPCTASLLTDSFEPAATDGTFSQPVGDRFVLMVNYDDDYDFSIGSTGSDPKITVFQKQDYKDYEKYLEENGGTLPAQTYMFWVETPGIADPNALNLTVDFQKAKLSTIFYQAPSDKTPETVLCKYTYTKNGMDFDFAAEMKNNAGMGDASVWSVKVKGTVKKVGFVLPDDLPADLTAEGLTAAYEGATMTDVSLKTSVTDSDWTVRGDNSKFVVIGGMAKTVVAAFVTDAAGAAVFDSENAGVSGTGNSESYQIAVCGTDDEGNVITPGTVTAPQGPAAPEGYKFGGWRGFEGTAPDLMDKIYDAGDSISIIENTSLTCVWEPDISNIKINLNGGTGGSNVTSVLYGQTLSLPEDPVRDGFTFSGWTVGKDVTQSGTFFSKGSLFDFSKGITSDLDLTAKWRHVHSYSYYRLNDPVFHGSFDEFSKYFPYYHVRFCGCSDVSLEAHSYNGDGVCACGYEAPNSAKVTMNVSYGILEGDKYTVLMQEREAQKSRKQEVTVYGPGYIDEYKFVKWQFSTNNGSDWHDLAASPTVSFIIPCSAQLRAVYEDSIKKPQIDFKVEWRHDHMTMLYWMDYKLPDGYSYVDAGVRCGDNQSMAYYDMKEKSVAGLSFGEKVMSNVNYLEVASGTISGASSMGPAGALAGFAYSMGMAAGASALETALDDWLSDDEPVYVHVEREDSILNIMSSSTLGGYIYRGDAINWDVPTYYWTTRPGTQATGKTGSSYVLIPPKYPQRNDGNHWIYGVAYLQYKTPDGQIQTIYTDALPATMNNVDSVNPISKTAQ